MDELLGQPTRARLLDSVRRRPGASGRELQRELGLAWGETSYHLDRLVRAGALRRERGGRRDYYFHPDVPWDDRKLMQSLRSPSERAIAIHLARGGAGSFSDIRGAVGLGKSTTSYHLATLARRGAVETVYVAGTTTYRLVQPERVASLLRSYRASFGDRLVDRFVESFAGILGA